MTARTRSGTESTRTAMRGSPLQGVAARGCGSSNDVLLNSQPAFVAGVVQRATFDGSGNDLLTAGLSKTGLQSAVSPTINDALNPTAAELRRLAIYNNYRALVDITTSGGFGVLFGPNVDANGVVGTREGKIAGTEYLAFGDDGTGKQNVTMLVQIPATFNRRVAVHCHGSFVGSRGVYGAIATAGEWGLKRLRRRLHRQGHRQWRARPGNQHRVRHVRTANDSNGWCTSSLPPARWHCRQ